MKTSFIREQFLGAANIVHQVIGMKTELPVLSNFFIRLEAGQVFIKGTNLETTIETKIPAKIEEKGDTTAPARLLIDFLQSVKDEKISMEVSQDTLKIKAESAFAEIPTINPSEFPKLGEFDSDENTKVESEDLIKAVLQVVFCSAADEGRPVLTGVLFKPLNKKVEVVATDGYRLAKKTVNATIPSQIIIPAKALRETVKALSEKDGETVEIATSKDKNQWRLSTKNTVFTTRLLDGDFPNYEQIIPTSFLTTVEIGREGLLDAIRTASLFARDAGNVVSLQISDNDVKVKAATAQVGEAEIQVPGKTQGEDLKIAFNSRFLLDSLSAIKERKVKISFSGGTTATMIAPVEESGLFYIVMPVRTQS